MDDMAATHDKQVCRPVPRCVTEDQQVCRQVCHPKPSAEDDGHVVHNLISGLGAKFKKFGKEKDKPSKWKRSVEDEPAEDDQASEGEGRGKRSIHKLINAKFGKKDEEDCEQECWEEPQEKCWEEQECWTEPREECHTAKQCARVPHQKCKKVPRQSCTQVPEKKCRQVPHKTCHEVPHEKCRKVPHEECWDEPHQVCWQVPHEKCWDEPREKCWDLTTKVGKRICEKPEKRPKEPE